MLVIPDNRLPPLQGSEVSVESGSRGGLLVLIH